MKLSKSSKPPPPTFFFVRREGFNSPAFAAMGWIWASHYWTELEHMLKWGTHMKAYLNIVQRDLATCGEGWEHSGMHFALIAHIHFLHIQSGSLFTTLREQATNLRGETKKKIVDILDKRQAMFDFPEAFVANALDYRFRGRKLSPSQRRQVVLFLQNDAAQRLAGVVKIKKTDLHPMHSHSGTPVG